MTNESAVAKPKTLMRRLSRFVVLAGATLIAVSLVANWIWEFSGSNQWELVGTKDGVTIYSLKTPGSHAQKFKCVFRVRSTLAGLVALMQDPEACADMGCTESRLVERVDGQLQYLTFQYKLRAPFRPREFVVRMQAHQDRTSKEVLVVYSAALGKTPLNSCCFRVADFNNTWQLTPLGDRQVQIEYIVNMNEGGFMPNLLLNVARPKIMFRVLPRLQRILDKEKYQNAKLDFIEEKP